MEDGFKVAFMGGGEDELGQEHWEENRSQFKVMKNAQTKVMGLKMSLSQTQNKRPRMDQTRQTQGRKLMHHSKGRD